MALLLAQPGSVAGQLVDLLTGRTVTATVTAGTLLGFVWGAVEFIKTLAGRRIAAVEQAGSGMVTVTLADGTKIEGVAAEIVDVARDLDFRNDLSRVMAPLERGGIDSVEFTTSRTVRASVTKSDLPAMEVPSMPSERLPDLTRQALVQPVGVEFDWRRPSLGSCAGRGL